MNTASKPVSKSPTYGAVSHPSPVSPTAVSPVAPSSPHHPTATASSTTSNRAVVGLLEKYQKDRLYFVQSVAEQALRESNVDALSSQGAISLLKPLLSDPVPSIQQSAAVALGRLANHRHEIATDIIRSGIIEQLVASLEKQNRFYKKAAAFVVRSVAKHSAELAQAAVEVNVASALAKCLEEFDPSVKEAAASALGHIARHNADLAQSVVDSGGVSLLLLCLQEPEIALKRVAASALADIARHTPDLAQCIVDAHGIPIVSSFVNSPSSKHTITGPSRDFKLMRHVLACLTHIAKHSLTLAESVVDGQIFPHIFKFFKSSESNIRRASAELVGEIVKHSVALAQLFSQTGGIAVIVDYLATAQGSARVPGIMTLGHIASMNETMAMSVSVANGVTCLSDILDETGRLHDGKEVDYSLSAACWALGQISKYSPEHAKPVYDHAVMPKLLKVMTADIKKSPSVTDSDIADLKSKAKKALKAIIKNTIDIAALDPVLQVSTPVAVLKNIVAQYAKILPTDVSSRKFMVTSGGLARVQLIAAEYLKDFGNGAAAPKGQSPEKAALNLAKLAEGVQKINASFPDEIVKYYSPGFSTTLLSKLDEFSIHKASPSRSTTVPKLATGGPSKPSLKSVSETENTTAIDAQ